MPASKIKRLGLLLLLLVICGGWPAAAARAKVKLPAKPPAYVVDLAAIIDPATEQKLNLYLRELEEKTTAQLVVLTIRSLEGEPLEEFSLRVANDLWRLGQQGKDNGALLVVSTGDRRYRFEIGYGLESILPDSYVGSLGRSYLVPYFRQGRYGEGIYRAVTAMAGKIAAASGVTISGLPRAGIPPTGRGGRRQPSLAGKIISIIFLLVLLIAFIRNPRLFLLMLLFSGGGGGRGGWGGGGGFGGGGGGGFGGGGASGGW
ncbi:MAG: TPM domain-containing protein [Deltaproteobacteria bacterium]|nr:TPM domain-containing protein [Deltaproteobacteria bacterium]